MVRIERVMEMLALVYGGLLETLWMLANGYEDTWGVDCAVDLLAAEAR